MSGLEDLSSVLLGRRVGSNTCLFLSGICEKAKFAAGYTLMVCWLNSDLDWQYKFDKFHLTRFGYGFDFYSENCIIFMTMLWYHHSTCYFAENGKRSVGTLFFTNLKCYSPLNKNCTQRDLNLRFLKPARALIN